MCGLCSGLFAQFRGLCGKPCHTCIYEEGSKRMPSSNRKSVEFLVAQKSDRRRRLLTPFAARVVALTPVGYGRLSTATVTKVVTAALGIEFDERTTRNYLSLTTRTAPHLVPNAFVTRLRRVRMRPVVRDFPADIGSVATLRLLDSMLRESSRSPVHAPVSDTILQEIELIRIQERQTFDVQKPRRVSELQPVAQAAMDMSLALSDLTYSDYRDVLAAHIGRDGGDDGPGALTQLAIADQFIGGEDIARWWRDFEGLKSDSIPDYVRRTLDRGERDSLSMTYRFHGQPRTMSDFLHYYALMKTEKAARMPMSQDELFSDFRLASQSRTSAGDYYEANRARMPESIKSLRTFQRRYKEWNDLQVNNS